MNSSEMEHPLVTKLHQITKELESKNSNPLNLLEKRLLILIKLKKYQEAIEEGYRIVGKEGAEPLVCRCIIVALCRIRQFDECRQVLEKWKKSSPNDIQMLETRYKIEPLLSAIRSGVNSGDVFKNLEDLMGLNSDWILKNCDDSRSWRCRPPPAQHTTVYMCPRVFQSLDCLFGERCLGAHSKRELEEWKIRLQGSTNSAPSSTNPAASQQPLVQKYNSANVNPMMMMSQQGQQGVGSRAYLPPPPPNISYLRDLIQAVRENAVFGNFLSEDVDGVKVKCYGPLHVRTNKLSTSWTIVIGSREPLRTVSLLHDTDRINFYVSGGFFHSGSSLTLNLIELHECNKNNVLQVLNTFIPLNYLQRLGGWPEWFYYRIVVTFRAVTRGKYQQTILFDFKKVPKLVRHVVVEVGDYEEDPEPISLIEPLQRNGPLLRPPSPPLNLIPKPIIVQNPVLDSGTGEPVYIAEIEDCDLQHHEVTGMNRWNYSVVMGKILKREMHYRQLELWRLNKTADLKLSLTYLIDRNNESEMKICVPGELFATVDLESELVLNSISEDSPLGRLVLRSCNEVIVTPNNNSGKRYLCTIVEKLNTSIMILMGKVMVRDLGLKADACLSFKIEMKLEAKNFEDMKKSLGELTVVESEYLFPDFSKGNVHFDTDASNYFFDGSYSLNPCQLVAYGAITNPVDKRNGLPVVPPILLIGPFGTGKTYTLSQSVKKLLLAGSDTRILICTHSNSAADIYITAIDEWTKESPNPAENKIPALRIYYADRHVSTVPKHVRKYCLLSTEGAKFRYPSKEELSRYRIVVSTLSSSSELIKIGIGKGFFTHIIIDEAAQALETEAIQPLLLADYNTRVVLAGDHMQLSPELFSAKEDVSVNLLERLIGLYPPAHSCRVMLSENYRSHEQILKFASDNFYQNSLHCATIQPAHPILFPLSFVHVAGEEGQGTTSYYNMEELDQVTTRIKHLVSTWPMSWGKHDAPGGIAVLTSYADQVIRLRTHLRYKGLGYVTVDRVLNVQGKQFRAVFISTVRTLSFAVENKVDLGFLSNPKLLNTALTRAQSLVMVIGQARSLCCVGRCQGIWAEYIQTANAHNALHGIDYNALKHEIEKYQMTVLEKRIAGQKEAFERVPSTNIWLNSSADSGPPQPQNHSVVNHRPGVIGNELANGYHRNSRGPYDVFQQPPRNESIQLSGFSQPNFNMNNLNSANNNHAQLSMFSGNNSLLPERTHSTPSLAMSTEQQQQQGPYAGYIPPISRPKPKPVSPVNNMSNLESDFEHLLNGGLNNSNNSPNFSTYNILPHVSHSQSAISSTENKSFGFGAGLWDIAAPIAAGQVMPGVGSPPRPSQNGIANHSKILNTIVPPGNPQQESPKTQPDTTTGQSQVSDNPYAHTNGVAEPKSLPHDLNSSGESSPRTPKSSEVNSPLEDFPPLLPTPKKNPSSEWVQVKPKKQAKGSPSTGHSTKVTATPEDKSADEKIKILCNMGFDKRRCIKALQFGDKDLDKAVEILLSGQLRPAKPVA